jgi:peptidyl-prolyl cis-trans isomerase B (cyclophilin B)
MAACSADKPTDPVTPPIEEWNEEMKNPVVTITMDDDSIIKIELYPDKAPNTVANFVTLVQDGFYNGLNFHRIVPGFMIQGGCPDGTGSGRIAHTIAGEFRGNGFSQNDLSHLRGTISMARTPDPDSAGSQFFICHDDWTSNVNYASIDGDYAAFGMVIEGMEVVDDIVNGPVMGDRALNPRVMKTVTVETFGVMYTANVIK